MYDYTLQVLWTRRRKGDHGAGCQFNNLPGNSGPPSTPPPTRHTRLDDTTSCQQLPSTNGSHNIILLHQLPSQCKWQWTLTVQGVFNPSNRSLGQGFPPAQRTTARCHVHVYIPPPPLCPLHHHSAVPNDASHHP